MLKSAAVFLMSMSSLGWPANLVDVKNYQEEGRFVSELIFDEPISSESLSVDFINETVQVNVPGGTVPKGKFHRAVDDPLVRSTFTYQVDPETLRNRIIYKGIPAESFAEKVDLVSVQNSLKIMVGDKPAVVTKAEAKVPTIAKSAAPPSSLNARTPSQNTKTVSDDEETTALLAQIEDKTEIEPDLMAHQEEQSIPVLLDEKQEKQAEADPFMRMLLSLGIVAVIGVFSLLIIKRWKKNSPLAGSNTQIRVLTQHHLGAKKSLAIIRVAGESVLIGITDHNISMIKSLSLIDDEFPEEVPQEFGGVLGKLWERDAQGKKNTNDRKPVKKSKAKGDDDFSIEGIKDIVSNRLKGMRSLD